MKKQFLIPHFFIVFMKGEIFMKKFLLCIVFIFALTSPAFPDDYEEHERKFSIFYESLEKIANQISWSSEYKLQDIEFIKEAAKN